jgi:AAA family ATP:ADP antiporter
MLSWLQRVVRACFFLWLSLLNLVGLSTMWARMSEVFGSHAGMRLFGFLGAGATCGAHSRAVS